jgi:hypothetical protein|tara:strand:- start:1298 stop:2377 length:1080 start_codon:yes stop_codon:yes gene_type:complete
MKKIIILKKRLEELYLKKGLSTRDIAKLLVCDQGVIQRRLKEYSIRIRYPKKEVEISKKALENLYVGKKLSTYKIADQYKCASNTIHRRLKIYGIETRPKKIVEISKERLSYLYHEQKLPLSRIAKEYECNPVAIFDKMKKFKIPSRTMSEAKTKHPKKDFRGSKVEKAYLVGFRLGDLNVTREHHCIKVKTNTTKTEQFELVKSLFERFGKVWSKRYGQVYSIQVALNQSFSFLLPKEDQISRWILNNKKTFLSFVAGYTDAEGNIGTYNKRPRVRIRTYDKGLLKAMHKKLQSVGIDCRYGLESVAVKGKKNKDCWYVSINKKESVKSFGKQVGPYLKHKKRKEDLNNTMAFLSTLS